MTFTANKFAAKALVAFVAFATVFTLLAPAAKAQTEEELQKMINDLMAQIAALQGQGGTSSSPASGICPFTWTRDLKTGATGADVMKLQQFLNSDADTRVAASGAGSVGMETQYFGPATAAAVSKFQVKFRADILTPAGLVNPTGFFGPSTRAKANALCVTGGTTTPDTDDEDEDEDDEDAELSGEASLDSFEVEDADSTDVEEGEEEVEIGVFNVEFSDGDAEITRLDIALERASANPWDAFETISLWVDGEEVASMAADDEDEYLDEDDGSLRFSDLEIIAMEDEELEITVAATIMNNLDSAELGEWDLRAGSVRYFDADGVASTDTATEDLDSDFTDPAATFTIEVAGANEELNFSLADTNPDATDIVVDTDSATDGVTILEYEIEAEDNDIELNELSVLITTGTTSSLVIDDVMIDIDGETFDAENAPSNSSNSTTFTFDVDGDVVIEADEAVTVKVMVDLRGQESSSNVARYANGTTIKAEVTATEVDATDAEGAETLGSSSPDQLTGTAIGETHNLVAEGIVIPVDSVEVSTDTSGENDTTGIFTIEFEVTAVEGDFYITDNVFNGTTSATNGVAYVVEGPGVGTTTGSLTSSADEDTAGVFTVGEGETETFTLKVNVDASVGGDFRVTLAEVNYSTNTNGTASVTAYVPSPVQDFRTGYQNIEAN